MGGTNHDVDSAAARSVDHRTDRLDSKAREMIAECERFERLVERVEPVAEDEVDDLLDRLDDPEARPGRIERALVRLATVDRPRVGASLRWFRARSDRTDYLRRLAVVAHVEWREARREETQTPVRRAG
ncbi:MAG: hypothetical protein ABEL76_11795 [Bradymonadaceae bacterium]